MVDETHLAGIEKQERERNKEKGFDNREGRENKREVLRFFVAAAFSSPWR